MPPSRCSCYTQSTIVPTSRSYWSLATCRLFLFRWGVASVDVADLVKVFDTMRLVLVQDLCRDEQARFPV